MAEQGRRYGRVVEKRKNASLCDLNEGGWIGDARGD